jgi:para-nitrobenzyl esterase
MTILRADTKYGAVKGKLSGNQHVSVFKGFPYAPPPVGKLRFMPPVEPEPWDGVRNCFEFAPISMQGEYLKGSPFTDFFIKEFYPNNHPMSEDSVYLNV